jgi:CRP-like cAMP-binding protein
MIKEIIKSVAENFSDFDFELLDKISTKKTYQKDEFILKQGNFCHNLWFIEQGAVKAYENSCDGERTIYFFLENTFFTNYYCWVTKNPSDISFKAVENSSIIQIHYPSLEKLCEQHHIFDTVGRKMAEKIFVEEYHLRKLLLNCNAAERYEYLEKNRPDIFKRFSLKDIAGFIGVTDVSLSRIRRNRFK